jgi:hypothetical protein
LIPSNTGGGGHAGHGKTGMKMVLDGGEGEQMALFSVYFADEPSAGK